MTNLKNLKSKFYFFRIALTNSGEVLQVCPLSSMYFPCFDQINFLIEDMVVMGVNTNGYMELSILTKAKNSKQMIKVVEYPCKF